MPYNSFCCCRCCFSVAKSCPTLCDPIDCGTPGFPIHHQLLEPTQTHVHHIHNAIQPSHSLLSPSPSTFKLSQHQDLFQWVSSSHQVPKVSASASFLSMNTQEWLPLGLTGCISLQSMGLSKIFSNAKFQKHQYFSFNWRIIVQLSYPYMTTGKTVTLTIQTFVGKVISLFFKYAV